MGKLKFQDINEWTPASISIIDQPSHPLAVFEVYEDDEEFVKKSIDIESDKMSNEEQNVTMSQSFFEKVFGDLFVAKSQEVPEEPKKEETPEEPNIEELNKKITNLESRILTLEKKK